jgi:hypothetical protein
MSALMPVDFTKSLGMSGLSTANPVALLEATAPDLGYDLVTETNGKLWNSSLSFFP